MYGDIQKNMGKIVSNIIIILLLIRFSKVHCEGDYPEVSNPSVEYEYMQIFRNIPTLFEYLLDMLQEKPEILEKDDVTVFKRDTHLSEDIDKKEHVEHYQSLQIEADSEVTKTFDNIYGYEYYGVNFGNLFLTPEEVANEALKVEKMLEEHNTK